MISIIERSGARMLNIINDIIDISKIESGTTQVKMKEVNINHQLDYIFTFFKAEAEKLKLDLVLKNSLSEKDAVIITDGEKIYAILNNLVKNAIKYTNKGSIEIGCAQKGHYIEFFVKDTGIGISKDNLTSVFERFIQADINDTKDRQGAGLGLAISKAYVEMLNGKLWVESEIGIGSTFYFNLPSQINEKPRPESETKVNLITQENLPNNLKILIAEDDEISETLISIHLNPIAKEILKAKTGKEAVEISHKNSDIDIIMMDVQMPVMSGLEATRQIREYNKKVIIIAQTAFGLSGDKEKSIAAGCNDYISKPIKKDELLALVQKYFKN